MVDGQFFFWSASKKWSEIYTNAWKITICQRDDHATSLSVRLSLF